MCPAEGLIIESYMDGGKGPVATAIIKKGILRSKDIIATDLALAKVKSLKDFKEANKRSLSLSACYYFGI